LAKLPKDESGKLIDWLKFLKAEVEEEFKMLAMKDPMINEAYCKLQAMSDDEAIRMLYQARLKAQRDEYARIQGARQEGRQDGWQEGRQDGWQEGERKGKLEGKLEAARNALKEGLSVEQAARITGIPADELKKYL
jgi:predicted transposase/invertase (TIGR01784 family)